MRINRTLLVAAVVGLSLAGAASSNVKAAPAVKTTQAKWVYGPAKTMGNGKCSSFIKLDAAGNPLAVGFALSDKCLTGLPPGKFDVSDMLDLKMPKENPTGFNHLELDWNAQGHDPKPIYGVPHFDFHFYLCDDQMLNMVMGGPDTTPVETEYIPTDYISGVDSVPHMGTHWVDKFSPEFHGKPFTSTFIYGFYKGDMKFVEPMITLDFLKGIKENGPFIMEIKQPEAFQHHAWYPEQMRLEYNSTSHQYFVTLDDLAKR